MTTTKKHIGDLHADHQLWLSDASFYADELRIWQKRLDEVAQKNTKPAAAAQVEHFQNQLIIQKEQLDIVNHEVKGHEQFLATFAAEHPVAIDHKLFANHETILDKIEIFKKLYAELKNEFTHFLSAVM